MDILTQFAGKVKGVLSTFDRMIIKGHSLQLSNLKQFGYFLAHNNILMKDFGDYALSVSESLSRHIENLAASENRPYKYLNSPSISKEETALELLKQYPLDADKGLIAVLSAVELCSTISVKANDGIIAPCYQTRKCKYYYLYAIDKDFGFMHIKIQTWFPFGIQIYINGREYLSRLLNKENIKYARYDNCFTDIADLDRAQELADKINSIDLSNRFDALADRINNFLPVIKETFNYGYYWCMAECEYATDIMFDSRESLERIYLPLVEKAFFSFKCNDIMAFMGRKMHNAFRGEIVSDLRKRTNGFRIKHRMKKNHIKMYDKASVLRIETTINDPKEFKVYKQVHSREFGFIKRWIPMGKSISNLYRYAEISKAVNYRYIRALNDINPVENPAHLIHSLSSRISVNNRIYSGFNLLAKSTSDIFELIADGKFLITGFTNKNIIPLYAPVSLVSVKTKAKITRLLAKLRAHGLIRKTPKALKYYITPNGRKIISAFLYFKNKEFPFLMSSPK